MSSVSHPNNTTHEHLQKLYDLGLEEVSFGVQDYSQSSKGHSPRATFHNVAKFFGLGRLTLR
jgi:oxygen-independent coproporphyrinogen-3 oxidase